MLRIKKTRTALHPQSDGQVERQHQTILQYLSKFIEENQRNWDRWIPMFLLAYMSSKHEIIQMIPAELYFGRDLNLPLDLLRGSPPNSGHTENPDNYVRNLQEKLDEIHQDVRDRMKMKSYRVKGRYRKLGIVFSNKVKKSSFIILEERKGKLLIAERLGRSI